MDSIERARRYLRSLPGSISGQGGDRYLYLAAYHLVVGFGLDEDSAIELLDEFNNRLPDRHGLGGCWPRWSQERIAYKIEQASLYAVQHPDQVGYLLGDSKRDHRWQQSRRRARSSPGQDRGRRNHQELAQDDGNDQLVAWERGQIAWALAKRLRIILTYPTWRQRSPVPLPERDEDGWELFLGLFDEDDIIWIGRRFDSGRPEHEAHFRTRREWQALPSSRERRIQRLDSSVPHHVVAPTDFGEFTCGSTFKPGSVSRCNDNVKHRRFLVTEMDRFEGAVVPKAEQAACIEWLRSWLRLRAVVDSAGKSLHAFWDYPDESTMAWLKIVLPALGFDPAMFTPSQPCRMPGALRLDRRWRCQALLYANLG